MSRTFLPSMVLLLVASCDCGSIGTDDGGFDGRVIEDATPSDVPRKRRKRCGSHTGRRGVCLGAGSRDQPRSFRPYIPTSMCLSLSGWEIANDGRDPVETRTRMNEAIQWATEKWARQNRRAGGNVFSLASQPTRPTREASSFQEM